MRRSARLACVWLVGLYALAACGQGEPPPATYLLFGSLTSTRINASGAWAYLRVVPPDGDLEDSVLYLASCQLNGPSCNYQINRVVEGQYTVYGLIDLVPGANPANPLPESGDLISAGRPLIVFDRLEFDFPDEAWRLMP